MNKPKIAIAGFIHETNTFSPYITPASEFEKADGWPKATRGDEIFSTFRDLNIGIGGFITEGTDFELVPLIWCSAEPASYVTTKAFETYCGEICESLKSIEGLDGVLLDLHGAMVVEGIEDGEGEVLRRVRAVVGDIPVVITLDFHANISAELVELCSAITLYREYPHLDMAETGVRATRLMRQILATGKEFKKSFRQVPYLIPLSSQATGCEPFATIYADFSHLEKNGVVSVDAAAGFPPADIADCGPSVLAYGTDQLAADRAVDQLYKRFMDAESHMPDNLLSEKEAILEATRLLVGSQQPVVLADVQDNPGAGGTNNTTGILRELLRLDIAPAIVGIITDAEAVASAFSVGIDGRIEVVLAAQETSLPEDQSLSVTCDVVALSEEKIACTGAMYGGSHADLGRTALLRMVGQKHEVLVMISELRFQCVDLALLRHLRLVLEKPQIIVVKSTAHFRADFDPIAKETLLVESPGLNPCRLANLDYQNLRDGVRI
ncbi:M81 family metallopeptidase [Alphaproteobacteria bacterium]|nr:M81 family metallopeptidase [Alphaproteobacteria bacterium]